MSQLRKLWHDHPNLVSWLVLAVGMVVIVVIAARTSVSRRANGQR